jgi:glycosyltransferase involved in cell wall biosynthesis
MEKEPLVSVIIPTFNRNFFLEKTLESVKNQSFKNLEAIVVNDGGSIDDCKTVCSKYDFVRLINIQNTGGPAKPRNVGIQNAKGEYLCFLDDDDLFHPDKLKIQVKILDENYNFGLAHSYCCCIDENDFNLELEIGRPKNNIKHGYVVKSMIGNWTLMTSSVMIRKSIVEKVGFFNESMPAAGEDVEYWTRCAFETVFFYIDKPLVYYRYHNSNISSKNKNYLFLNNFLKKIVVDKFTEGKIDKNQYEFLLNKLIRSQLNKFKEFGYVHFYILSDINKYWFLNMLNLKHFVKIIKLK